MSCYNTTIILVLMFFGVVLSGGGGDLGWESHGKHYREYVVHVRTPTEWQDLVCQSCNLLVIREL